MKAGITALIFVLAILVAGVCLASEGPDASVDQGKAARVKAAYLYHLVRLTEWPEDTFESDVDSLCIAVVGDDAQDMVGLFRRSEHDLLVDRHPISIARASCEDAASGRYQLVFVTDGVADLHHWLDRCQSRTGLLLAGDLPDFCNRGGMVGFALEGGRVRILVNQEALTAAGLRVSARFLQHAIMVKGGS